MKEIWKPIKDYEGLYQISNFGRVRSTKRTIKQKKNNCVYSRVMQSKILKQGTLNSGYAVVWLSKKGLTHALTVHRLVAEAFFNSFEGKTDVNHIDGNKKNNIVTNLEWTTRSENIQHSYRKLKRKTIGKTIICVETEESFESITAAAKFAHVSRGAVQHAVSGLTHKAGGYTWRLV